ncbi:hypothetical protein AU210_016454 [Fusarium oxysporum f. sp. radicis-cucumerinum]|uniref:BTB domain-containing protein n=1 Tax=Fusarium oxysporum f. sp. radicis-cucumerinum TaxID=327505 RepID=A0A2H3GAZ8_FUSOX|nr:hypothetical protein AU210_016454 [Fusarium oxysporum f. sp. radicis-cucumerinum]
MSDRDAMATYRLQQATVCICESQPTTRFLVGRSAKEHNVPSKLLVDGFTGCKSLFEAPKKAWINPEVVLEDCTEDTFKRFWQALLTADYDEAMPKEIPPAETTALDLLQNHILQNSPFAPTSEPSPVAYISQPPLVKEEGNCRDSWAAHKADDEVNIPHKLPYSIRSYRKAWDTFRTPKFHPYSLEECQHTLRHGAITFFLSRHWKSSSCPSGTKWKPKKYDDLGKSYLPVFMSHFELFKIANELGFEMICKVSLHRLTATLCSYTVHEQGIPDLVHLVREVYGNTKPGNPARTLILDFIACFYEHICSNDSFVLASREVDDLLRDVSNIMRERYLPTTDLVKKRKMSEKASDSTIQPSASRVRRHKRTNQED